MTNKTNNSNIKCVCVLIGIFMYCPPPQNDHNITRTFEINGALEPIGPVGSNYYGIDAKEVREKLKFHLMNEGNVEFQYDKI